MREGRRALAPVRMLRLPAVLEIVPYSESVLYDMIKAGTFPRPVRIGARATAWLEDEIVAWQNARIHERDKGSQKLGEAA